MRVLDDIPFEIDPEAVFTRLHLDPNGPYASEVNALIDNARRVARPRALYKTAAVRGAETDLVMVTEAPSDAQPISAPAAGGRSSVSPPGCGSAGAAAGVPARFVSRALRVNLDGVEWVFPYVATCGRELDSIPIAPGDVFGQFCLDTIKELALWAAITRLYEQVTEASGLSTLASMNPGSGEINVWPIEQQQELFAFLGGVRESIGVVLTDSCLMVPNKSVSGILYPSADGFESCQLCRQERCPNRRVPFDADVWARTFGEEGAR